VEQQEPVLDGLEVSRRGFEPAERRVTRTLAQALSALQEHVIEPAKEVRKTELHPFVDAGGSRELVNALSNVLTQESVAQFTASFSWAEAVPGATSLPTTFQVPAAAQDLLKQSSRLLRDLKVSRTQVLTGPVVLIEHPPGDPFGEIAIQTMRNGRVARVHVRVRVEELDQAHEWMREERTVLVEGAVRAQRSQPLMVDKPRRVGPLDETMLSSP
jgi:hypothetical protein